MTTQTLRGLSTHGAMHWRGDRATGFFNANPHNPTPEDAFDEELSFKNFIVAFDGLNGSGRHHHAGPDAGVQRLHAVGGAAAEPGTQPRQPAHGGAAARRGFLLRPPGATEHRRDPHYHRA